MQHATYTTSLPHPLSTILRTALPFASPTIHFTHLLRYLSFYPIFSPCQPSPGDSGWEVFSLDYVVDVPLNAVVHSEAMSRYRTAFHMLWRLKRVEWSLSGSWKQLMSFSHAKGEEPLPALKSVLHRYCTALLSLQGYCCGS